MGAELLRILGTLKKAGLQQPCLFAFYRRVGFILIPICNQKTTLACGPGLAPAKACGYELFYLDRILVS